MALTLFEDTFLLPNTDDYTVDFTPYFPDDPVPTYMTADKFVVNILNREDVWNEASVQDKENALVAATIQMNYVTWNGTALTEGQTLSWPRAELVYEDRAYGQDITVQEGLLPERIKLAMELSVLYIIQHSFEGINKYFTNSGTGEFTLKIDDVEYTDNRAALLNQGISALYVPFTQSTNYRRQN